MEQTNINWIQGELEQLSNNNICERNPSLHLENNEIVEFEVDFSKPFDRWQDPTNQTIKKIIPILLYPNKEKRNFWLNVANPLYRQMLELNKSCGQTKFKVQRQGQAKATKYVLIK